MARVLHFEVLCRALGYDPSLLLFHRFFRLAKNGDWFTFETSKVDTCLISSMVTTLGTWKDRFFWVSDSIIPFKMVWRHPDAVLNEPEPYESDLNDAFLKAIRECPSRVLMSALDFIKSDDTSDVVFTDAQAAEGDDAVARGVEQWFKDTGYVSVSNVKSFSKPAAPKASTRRSTRRLLKGAPQSTSSEPVELSDDIKVSEGQGVDVDVEKEKKLVLHGKKKTPAKKVMATPVHASSSRDVEGLDPDEVYVPGWSVKLDDGFKDAAVCDDVLSHIAPPSDHSTITEMDDDMMLSRMNLSTRNLAGMLPRGVARFRKRVHEYEEFSKKKEKMKSSMAAMKKEIGGFAEKEEAWVKKVGELTRRHEIELGDLKKSFEADPLKLKADREALYVQQKAFDEEKEGLKALVAQATNDNQWLIEQGFQQVVTYLLHSKEFNFALGEVYTKLLNLGKHQGLIVGYKLHESGQSLEKSPLYRPEASEVFKGSVEQMERLTYPYELKPEGLNEKVCAEVLGSLSRKRSYSGDSDDTLSEGPAASKDASLEGSTVGGDGGLKAKKSKKAKKVKSDGSGASKPSADA
ncbi:hypothetical protein HanIR_Chr03g0128221 [Helianthus annuus]|nr:hypothetical protein HanIR_Chr03g0128221 [Helianthus annuus]